MPIRERRPHRSRKKRSQKTGLPPGTLVHVGERLVSASEITLFCYGEGGLEERRFESVEASRTYRPSHPNLWLNVYGLHQPEVMSEIGRRFNLHPLVLEDIVNTDQRVKLEDYGDYLFLVVKAITADAAGEEILTDQISLVIGRGFVLSFQERPSGTFDPVRERLRQDRGQIRRQGADFLAYSLIDMLVDRCFNVLETLIDRTDALEERALQKPGANILPALHVVRRETLALRRVISPLREAVSALQRADTRLIQPATQVYLRDVYDHLVHLVESIDALRDLQGGMLDIYLSSLSNRVNAEVRLLTVITTLLMPASLIAGIFGMNFRSMPWLTDAQGFYVALALMAVVGVAMGMVIWRRMRA
jgi:magnesium transporter